MKLWAIILFLLPLLGCIYAGWHVWRILPLAAPWRWAIVLVLVLACVALPIFNLAFGLDKLPMSLARAAYEIGYSGFFVLLYLVLLFLLLDLLRLLGILPAHLLRDSLVGTTAVVLVISAIFIYGYCHFMSKHVERIEIKTTKPLSKKTKILVASDLHLGYHINRAELQRWVEMFNREQPDLILLVGDLVDVSMRPVLEEQMSQAFHDLKAPVYACFGNHDYYAGRSAVEQFMQDAGITLLCDSVVTTRQGLTLIGRDDRTNPARQSVNSLMRQADASRFVVLLDHQPYHLERAQRAGVDLQLSGHTHNGQVWPINWIVNAIYEDGYGYLKKENSHFYVTSGIGIWGGKFRIGTRSEYAVITLIN